MNNSGDAVIQYIEESDTAFSSWSFYNEIKEILEKMTGLSATEHMVIPDIIKEFDEEISSVTMLLGSKKIMFSVSMSKKTAINLVAAMTGLNASEIDLVDSIDGAAELANIIGGKFKARLDLAGEKYSMLLPYTIIGDDHYIVHKSRVAILIRKFKAKDIEFIVRVFLL